MKLTDELTDAHAVTANLHHQGRQGDQHFVGLRVFGQVHLVEVGGNGDRRGVGVAAHQIGAVVDAKGGKHLFLGLGTGSAEFAVITGLRLVGHQGLDAWGRQRGQHVDVDQTVNGQVALGLQKHGVVDGLAGDLIEKHALREGLYVLAGEVDP